MKRGLLHYAPEDGWFGDPMPVYADGVYHIYYTKLSDKQGWLCWGHVATRDWKEYQELPDCLLPDDRDVSLTTGSVLYHEGVYHAFYAACGTDGIYRIFSAVSRDGVLFEKNRESLLPEGRPGYRGDDTWRDPCVFWNPAESCFWMVFCARRPSQNFNSFPGVLGLAKSADLAHWRLCPPLWEAGYTTAPECPDLFPIGNRWALLYYWHETRIRYADSPAGPFIRGPVISPDHFDMMAGKRLSDGRRHILLGWIPRKSCDCGERIWGGHMACPRELTLNEDGRAGTRFLPEVDAWFPREEEPLNEKRLTTDGGSWSFSPGGFTARAETAPAFAYAADMPADYRLRFRLRLQGAWPTAMLLLRTEPDSRRGAFAQPVDEGYQLIWEKESGLLRLRELYMWDQRSDLAVVPWRAAEGCCQVDLLLHGDLLEVGLDGESSLVCRLLKHPKGDLAFCVQDGALTLEGLELRTQ